MKALSLGSTAAIRSRQARVSWSAVISRLRSIADASLIVSLLSSEAITFLFDDFRNFEIVALARRRIREHRIRRRLISHFVVAHRRAGLANLRGRRDLFGIELVQLVHVREHLVHVRAEPFFLIGREPEPRQASYVANLFEGYFRFCHRSGSVSFFCLR